MKGVRSNDTFAQGEFDTEVWLSNISQNQLISKSWPKEIDANIRHEAVPVPLSNCPFTDDVLSLFEQGLRIITDSGDVPSGYGATFEEMDGGIFDEEEEIKVGLQRKGYAMQLPRSVWKPRMELWAQGLFAMNNILALEI